MSKIEWTEQTWNPIIGCSKVSPGCKNCYAMTMAYRIAHMELNNSDMEERYLNVVTPPGKWDGKTHFVESALDKPLKRKKPTMYFVCSMGDLFHESVLTHWIDRVMDVIRACPQHTFQILTKRPERMQHYFALSPGHQNYKNVWLGVTAENQEQANKRIPILLEIPAKVRFVSVEPMLEKIDFPWFDGWVPTYSNPDNSGCDQPAEPMIISLDWVICGGESGYNARPMHPDWVRSLRDQCKAANVPFFFKQWGEWIEAKDISDFNYHDKIDIPGNGHYYRKSTKNELIDRFGVERCHNGETNAKSYDSESNQIWMEKIGKKKAGSLLDEIEYKQYPSK